MNPKEVAEDLKKKLPDTVTGIEEFKGAITLRVERDGIVDVSRSLRDDYGFVLLIDIYSVHYPEEALPYVTLYQFCSLKEKVRIFCKVSVEGADEGPPSITGVYPGADWLESEVYDLMGIKFQGHPDLKRILTPEDFKGFPLRKDFPLRG